MLNTTRVIARRLGRGRATRAISAFENIRGIHCLSGNAHIEDNAGRQKMRGIDFATSDEAATHLHANTTTNALVSPLLTVDVAPNEDDDGG